MNTVTTSRTAPIMSVAVILTLCLAMGGCIGCCTPSVYHGPASSLDVRVTVLDLDEKPGDGRVPVVVQFLYSGNPVQIDPGITVTCNGVTMAWSAAFFGHIERIPLQQAKGIYEIVHREGRFISTARAVVPERPVFKAPTIAGATIPRSTNFTIRYVADGGNAVLGRASDARTNVSSSQMDDGSHDGLDVSGFAPGPGRLSITRTLETPLPTTGFLSAQAIFEMNTSIAITWQ